MRRDQLKILLSGILVLLLGSLIVYSYLFREDISRFLKKKEGEEVSNNSKTDRVILSPEMNLTSPNDLNSLPDSGEFSANEKETSKERKTGPEEFSSNAKEAQSSQEETQVSQEERPEERKTLEKTPKDKFPEEKWIPPETSTIKDEESPREKMKNVQGEREKKSDLKIRSQPTKKKIKMKKRSSFKTGKRIHSLETRVDRLERRLGISHTRRKHKPHGIDRKSLEKRVWKLEKEMEKLKSKK